MVTQSTHLSVTPNCHRTHTVPKFGLQIRWITRACHYTRLFCGKLISEILFGLQETLSLRKRCPYSLLVWSAFFLNFPAFGLNTEDTPSLKAGKCSKNADQNNSKYVHFLCSVWIVVGIVLLVSTLEKLNLFHMIFKIGAIY